MGERRFKVGTKLIRKQPTEWDVPQLRNGDVGEVIEENGLRSGRVRCLRTGLESHWSDEYCEPLTDTPAEPAPKTAPTLQGPWEKIAILEASLATAQKQLAEAIGSKTGFGDVIGERDQLKEKLAFAEDDVRFYKRETLRLGGKLRPERGRR